MAMYKVGELAKLAGVTVRTIRYYDEKGLLKTHERTHGGQRIYSEADLVYLKRITELKRLGFALEEIKDIILKGSTDKSGEVRRRILLDSYRRKKDEVEKRIESLKSLSSEIEWHISQLEGALDSFQECPGSLCQNCSFYDLCKIKVER